MEKLPKPISGTGMGIDEALLLVLLNILKDKKIITEHEAIKYHKEYSPWSR